MYLKHCLAVAIISVMRIASAYNANSHYWNNINNARLSFVNHVKKIKSETSHAYGFIVRNYKNFTSLSALKYYANVRSHVSSGFPCIYVII